MSMKMAEAYHNLTPAQRHAIKDAEDRQAEREKLSLSYDAKQAEVCVAVTKALNGGVSAQIIAHRLGITRTRVYQMRDEVRAADRQTSPSTTLTTTQPESST